MEGVDRLELVVEHGHLDEGVEVGIAGRVAEGFEVCQFSANDAFALGRRVDDLAGAIVGNLGARLGADPNVRALDGLDDLDEQIGGKHRSLGEGSRAVPKGVVVVEDLLGVRGNSGGVQGQSSEEFVVCGEQVLNLRGGLGFL